MQNGKNENREQASLQTCSRSFYFIRRQPCQRARARLAAWLIIWPEGIWRQPCQRARARLAAWLAVWYRRSSGRQPCHRARARLAAWLAVWYRRSSGRQPCHRARARLAAWLAVWYRRKPGRQPAVACKPLERISVLAGKTLHRRHIRFCGQRCCGQAFL